MEREISDPINWLIDALIRIIINLFIPISLPAEIIIQLKTPILSILINCLLIFLLVIFAIFGVVALPFIRGLTHLPSPGMSGEFSSTDIPSQNPFGVPVLSYVTITAYFHDPAYFAQFHVQHEGVDMVPNDTYYQESNSYQKNKPNIVIYATNNGTINYFTDRYGANSVIDSNPEGNLQTEYLHLNQVYVHTGEQVIAGTPVGTMGDTGFSTGAHLHYQINLNENGNWTPTDPLGYIQ